MTDTPSSPTDPADDDLLASLYLDGEATAEERAKVEADPTLLARVRAFEAIAEDLADIAPPAGLAPLQISAALELFDEQQSAASSTSAAAPTPGHAGVTSLGQHRARKQSRGLPTWLSAAAALALVVGGLGFASTLGGDDDDFASVDTATDRAEETFASGASRTVEDNDAAAAPEAAESEAMSTQEMDTEEMETEATDEDLMQDEAMEESVDDEATADVQELAEPPSDEAADTSVGPTPLDGLDAETAAEYLELLSDQPLQPIEASPCAGSPLVEGLFGVDSFIPVVFDGETSSLLVQAGAPATAVIVGPTCEIELE